VQQHTTAAATPVPEGGDADLIHRIQGGERAAFEGLYKRYIKKIYGLVFRMVGSAQEAEEVTQEAFLQVYKAIPGFQGKSSFYTWIYRIATNVALQHVKKASRRRRETSFEEALETDAPAPGIGAHIAFGCPEKAAESRDFYTALEKAINALPPNQRVVMILGPIQGHTYEQMAQITGTSEEIIKGRLHRARENIRAWLKHHR
jgi:RNA polymerase sigma-70 factor (ECF subfamily)